MCIHTTYSCSLLAIVPSNVCGSRGYTVFGLAAPSAERFHRPAQRIFAGDRAGICVTQLDSSLLERGASVPRSAHDGKQSSGLHVGVDRNRL